MESNSEKRMTGESREVWVPDEKFLAEMDSISQHFGLHNISYAYETGRGSHCATDLESGHITINLDPTQKNGDTGEVYTEGYLKFIAYHELSHAQDKFQPGFSRRDARKQNAVDGFFYNLVDDTAIDADAGRTPMFRESIDDIYRQTLPHRLSQKDLPTQLMYAILIGQVTPETEIEVGDRVREEVRRMREVELGGERFDVIAEMAAHGRTFAERRTLANKFIKPVYDELVREEVQNGRGRSFTPDGVEFTDQKIDGDLAGEIAKAIKQQGRIETVVKAKESAERMAEAQEREDMETEVIIRDLADIVGKTTELSTSDARAYAEALYHYRGTIEEIAGIFMRLATPTDAMRRPVHSRRVVEDGARLSPRAIYRTEVMEETGNAQAVFQPVERTEVWKELEFGGFDIHLLIDSSGSMQGDKARCAADTAVCLVEGLQYARQMVASANVRAKDPDVRIGVSTFSDSVREPFGLSYEPSGEEKGRSYADIMRADGGDTLLAPVMERVVESQSAEVERQKLVIIVSDGRINDIKVARSVMGRLTPETTWVKHVNIGSGGTPAAEDYEEIATPFDLPEKLRLLLAEQIRGEG